MRPGFSPGKLPPGIARFDSAAGMAQALGASLHGHEFRSLTGSAAMDRMLRATNVVPRRLRDGFYAVAGATEAVSSRTAWQLDLQGISAWLAGLYPDRTYPAAFIGSPNGAMVHLAAAIGAPWLPQTFLCPVQDAPPPLALDRFEALLRRHAAGRGVEITERSPAPAG